MISMTGTDESGRLTRLKPGILKLKFYQYCNNAVALAIITHCVVKYQHVMDILPAVRSTDNIIITVCFKKCRTVGYEK
jgi:hypothetical protein